MSSEQLVVVPLPIEDFEAVECIYEKDGIFIHISESGSEEIQLPGRLQIYEKDAKAFVRWLPLKSVDYPHDDDQGWTVISETPAGGEVDEEKHSYVIHFPLSDVSSVRCVQNAMSWRHLSFSLASGKKVPAMYFQQAQLQDFLQSVNHYLVLAQSPTDENLFEVRPETAALYQSLQALNFSPDNTSSLVTGYFSGGIEHALYGGLSRITQFVRSQLSATGDVPGQNGAGNDQAAGEDGTPNEQSSLGKPTDSEAACAETSSVRPEENDDLTRSWSEEALKQSCHASIQNQPVQESLAHPAIVEESKSEEDEKATPTSSIQSVHEYSVDGTIGQVINSVQPSSARHEEEQDVQDNLADQTLASVQPATSDPSNEDQAFASMYHSVAEIPGASLINLDGEIPRQKPITWSEWSSMLDSEGRLRNLSKFRRRLFKGGLEPSLRPLVWKFLLGYYSFDSTHAERERSIPQKREDYEVMKRQWMSMKPRQMKCFRQLAERQEIIGKDVVRTDRDHPSFKDDNSLSLTSLRHILYTHLMYNFDIGYVQGMTDLLSPILLVMGDESDAFWCFSGFIDSVEANFTEGMVGMRHQLNKLYSLLKVLDPHLVHHLDGLKGNKKVSHPGEKIFFCFRWLLLFFKREFSLEDTMRLWEVLWSQHMSRHFHLFFAAAILMHQSREIIARKMDTSDILRHVNDLAYGINLDIMLSEAERMCRDLLNFPNLPADLQDLKPQLEWFAPSMDRDEAEP